MVCRSGAAIRSASKSTEGLGLVIQASPRRAAELREDELDRSGRVRSRDSRIDGGVWPFGEGGGESGKGSHRCSPQLGAPRDVAHQRGGEGEDLRGRANPDDGADPQLGCPRCGILLPNPTQKMGAGQSFGVMISSPRGEFEIPVGSFCVGSMETSASRDAVPMHDEGRRRVRPPSPSPLLRSPTRVNGRRAPPARDSCERGPVGRVGGNGKRGCKEKTHSQNPPSRLAERDDPRLYKHTRARVRRRRKDLSGLVWVRRDLVKSGQFTADDCHPIGLSDWLPVPKIFKFSRDFWSRREGRATYASIVRGMAGPGGQQGPRGGRYSAGRGRNEGGRPPTPPNAPEAPVAAPPLPVRQVTPVRSNPPVSIYAKPPIVPLAAGPSMMNQGGQMYPNYGGWNPHFAPVNPWMPQPQYPYQFLSPPAGPPAPYPHSAPMQSSGSQAGSSGQAGTGKSKKKQKKPAGKIEQKKNEEIDQGSEAGETFFVDPKFAGAICYNCGLPGHFVGMCSIPKTCFICRNSGHHMDVCPTWYKPYPFSQYLGSANSGLGFYHIETGEKSEVDWLNFGNVGLVVVEEGEISAKELEKCFAEMWKTNWPWQIRTYDDNQYLVRFPPNKKIQDLVEYPSINLKKKGVTILFKDWNGELPAYDSLQEVWIEIGGLPPKWCSWNVIAQITSSLGFLLNVDWHGIFRSFYENVRVQVAVRDPTKIPEDRMFEFSQELYLLTFKVEDDTLMSSPHDPSDPGDDDQTSQGRGGGEDIDEDDLLGEEMMGGQEKPSKTPVARPTPAPRGSRNAAICVTPAPTNELEKTIFTKIQGAPLAKSYLEVAKKRPAENISGPLLAQFEEAVVDGGKGKAKASELPPIGKNKWGPVVATRVSARIQRSGIHSLKKAQELKQIQNLEVPRGKKKPWF